MSSEEDVSPKKQRRVERKREKKRDRDYEEEEEEDAPTSSRKSRGKNKDESPERKRKSSKKADAKKAAPAQAPIHVDAAYQPSDEEEEEEDEMEEQSTSRMAPEEQEEEDEYAFPEDVIARSRLETHTDEDAFEIPTRDADLLMRQTGYRITDLPDYEEAIASVESFEDEVEQYRWRALYDRFPAFFVLVRSGGGEERAEVPPALRCRLVNSLILAYSPMSAWMKKVLVRPATGLTSKKIRANCRDTSDHLLMMVYLLHKMVVLFEDEARSSKKKPKKAAGGRGRKKARAVQNEDGDMFSGGEDDMLEAGGEGESDESSWEEIRKKVVDTLVECANTTVVNKDGKTCEGALRYLWKTGSVDIEMLNSLLNCALKFLENPEITKPHSKPMLTSVFKLIRALCINFSYFTYIGRMLFEKLLSLDYYKEGTATAYPFLEKIEAVAVNGDTEKLIDAMLKYFTTTTISVSNNNAKALCTFMTKITELAPQKVLTNLQPFIAFLSDENASVRSTVLNVLSAILLQDFLDRRRALSPRFLAASNSMYDRLLQHVRDINANVRANALKCLTFLAKNKKIPAELIQEGLMQLVGQRISDDKVAVRKEAVRFATVFLENNPYGHDFDRLANEKSLRQSMIKRDRIRSTQAVEAEFVNAAQVIFDRFKTRLTEEVEKCAEEYVLDTFIIPDEKEREAIYRDFNDRQSQSQHGSQNNSTPTGPGITLRWLFTMILAEEVDVVVPARLLVAMAITGQLKAEHVSADSLKKLQSAEKIASTIMEGGHILFINTTAVLLKGNAKGALRTEQNTERRDDIERRLSRDIDDLVMKLVLERELAACLPSVMSSVMTGEGGDLKLGIDFVVKCKEFSISGSEAAVRQLCALVWKSDEEGRNQILQAASSMFLSANADPRLRDASTAENILNLVKSMSDHERGSVEQVLALTTRFEPIPAGVYALLWEQVDEENIAVSGDEKRKKKQVAAMKALCLLSRSDVERNRQWLRRYQNIVKDGWPEIAAEALGCIANLATRHTKEDKDKPPTRPFRIAGTDSLFPTIQQFMLAELCREEAQTWNRSLRATLDIYFHICKDTCSIVSQLVAKLMWLLRRTSQALYYYDQQTGVEETRATFRNHDAKIDAMQKEMVAEERSKYLTRLWSVLVERMCVLAGELAVRLLVHADLVYVREFMQAREKMDAEKVVPFPDRELKEWEVRSAAKHGVFNWSDNALDIEVTGLTDEERLRTKAQQIVEQRLCKSNQLLGRLLPIVVHAARAKGTPPRVRYQAVNALAKFMVVSPSVAQRGARTFFAHLNNAPSPILRSNLVVTAADLTFRHPNLVENHAASLFAQLQDGDSCVRESCMLILNHLISNDLLKTHGVLSYALTGYVDAVPSIQHITRGLFNDWSKKEGVMSHVPDFISRLSRDSSEVSLESFRTIMSHFLPLIRERKDSNVQALVEKLCKRFEFAKSPRVLARNPDMPAYYSHCLQQLVLNAKGFHKMVDCLENYRQFLGDDRVYEDISGLIKVFQKDDHRANGSSSDIADDVCTFLRRLHELHEQQKTEKEVEGKMAKMRFDTNAAPTSAVARKMKSRRAIASTAATPARGGARGGAARRGGGRRARVIESSSSSSDDDEEEEESPRRGGGGDTDDDE